MTESNAAQAPVIELRHVDKHYGDLHVLKDINLKVNKGEVVVIIGPSGSGKSTMCRTINRLETVDSGEILIEGKPLPQEGKELAQMRAELGMVFQGFNLFAHKTILENVTLGPIEVLGMKKDEAEKKAMELLARVGVAEQAQKVPAQLSGGQQQRVAIARSLVSSDELIVLDEPITNLDAKLREEMILEIQMIQQNIGTTIIYITHDQEAALQLCDRISIMQPDGQICQIGSDEEIIRRPANRFVYSFIGVSNFLPVKEKGGKVCLALGSEPVLFDKPPQDYVSGKKNVMGVRPMDIVFDAKSPIRATIQRDTFLGNQYDYQVELMGRELRVERNALDVLADPTRYEAGQEVGLKFLNVKFYEEEANA